MIVDIGAHSRSVPDFAIFSQGTLWGPPLSLPRFDCLNFEISVESNGQSVILPCEPQTAHAAVSLATGHQEEWQRAKSEQNFTTAVFPSDARANVAQPQSVEFGMERFWVRNSLVTSTWFFA